jgi:uncharacterized protein YbbC (DUF1343 family)
MYPRNQSSSEQAMPASQSARRSVGCALIALVLGVIIGAVALVLAVAFSQSDKQAVVAAPAQGKDAIQVHLTAPYITQLVNQNIQSSGLPGNASNVQVQLANNQITVTGSDTVSILGISVTKPFTLILQPLIQSCHPRMHVLHADLDGVPATGMVSSFEGSINQQLQFNVADLPKGFTYCAIAVQTEPGALVVDFSATPQ